MSAQEFRENGVDKRRLDEPDRSQYNESNAQEAMSRVKSFRAQNNYQENRPRSTTEQKPGSGGLKQGSYAQGNRMAAKSQEEARAKSLRNEDNDPANVEQAQPTPEENAMKGKGPVNADSLKSETKGGKYF